jgi:hypothetical protein
LRDRLSGLGRRDHLRALGDPAMARLDRHSAMTPQSELSPPKPMRTTAANAPSIGGEIDARC